MHKITLLSVGRVKTEWVKDGCALYRNRLDKMCAFTERVLDAGDKESENRRILKSLESASGTVVVLDETGKEFSSAEFASFLSRFRNSGEPLLFVIGGAYGLTPEVMARSKQKMALSRMTLPHELCQLIFLEQLYRAHSMLQGTGYHH